METTKTFYVNTKTDDGGFITREIEALNMNQAKEIAKEIYGAEILGAYYAPSFKLPRR